ncbi:hypothetical protein R1flu_014721 [Riccia fluitans]|uniref:Uncharacterized protein n=1 Tax=Riccia fluitans TaxID=41844 RepID=A0ABD1YH88_9MARC
MSKSEEGRMKEAVVGSVRPRSPGSPGSSRPSKVQKVTELVKAPSGNKEAPAPPAVSRDPIVIRQFDASAVSSFTCNSGELLWGHLNTLIEGSKSNQVDTTSGPHETMAEGSIIQHNFRYRTKARKGVWKVEPAFIGDCNIGYVCYHEDVNGVEILRQAAKVGISNANNHENRDIVFINRYDWGLWHDPGLQLVLDTLGLETTEENIRNMGDDGDDSQADYFWGLISKRFMLLDHEGLPALIQALKDGEKLKRKNYLFYRPPDANGSAEGGQTQNLDSTADTVTVVTIEAALSADTRRSNGASGEDARNGTGSGKEVVNGAEAEKSAVAHEALSVPFGVNVVTKDPEYELGWMIFEKGELVGFVYDGAYSALEVYPDSSELKLGGTITSVMEGDDDSKLDEDPPYAPSSDTESTDSEPDTRYYAGSETESEAGSQATSRDSKGGGDDEQGEECMSKEAPSSAPVLETIHEEEDEAEPSEPTAGDVLPVVVEKEVADPSEATAVDVPPVVKEEKETDPEL